MDVLKAVQTYMTKMITEVPGMKVLLLDAHTVSLGLRPPTDDLADNRHQSCRWLRRSRSCLRTRCILQIG